MKTLQKEAEKAKLSAIICLQEGFFLKKKRIIRIK